MDETKHLEEKLAHCEEMIQKNPTLASGYCEKGLLLREAKRYSEAIEAFEKAYQLDPSDSRIHDFIIRLKRYRIGILSMELWRIYYALIIIASGFTMPFLALRVALLFAIIIVILTIGAALILLLKTFRPAKR